LKVKCTNKDCLHEYVSRKVDEEGKEVVPMECSRCRRRNVLIEATVKEQ